MTIQDHLAQKALELLRDRLKDFGIDAKVKVQIGKKVYSKTDSKH